MDSPWPRLSGAGKSLLTDPAEVVRVCGTYRCRPLAVSIGTAHGVYISLPNLDITRLEAINKVSKIPLVLHGGSNTPVDQIQNAIRHGNSKINVYADYTRRNVRRFKIQPIIRCVKTLCRNALFRQFERDLHRLPQNVWKCFSQKIEYKGDVA
jgi:hypothetical protein